MAAIIPPVEHNAMVEQKPSGKDNKDNKDNQIFKTPVPVQLLWDFLVANFTETPAQFHVTKYLFHKTEYNQKLLTFITAVKPYYFKSKCKYIERQLTYKSFLTILRQLCNAQNILYSTKLVYNNSIYEIEYTVYKQVT